MNAAINFSKEGVSFSFTGEGVAIDPETGLVSISSAALAGGVDIEVSASGDSGPVSGRFSLVMPDITPAPVLVTAFEDQTLVLGGKPVVIAAAGSFSGENLAFEISGRGAVIDSVTGLVTIAADELIDGETVTVTASNPGGSATGSFELSVSAAAPAAVKEPVLSGTGVIGQALTVSGDVWSGAPAPEVSIRWFRDGVEISGVGGREYTPVSDDDGRAILAEVTARNAGGEAVVRTSSVTAVHAAPEVTGELADISATRLSGPVLVDAAAVFSGEDLSWSVKGAGASIDAETGTVSVPTGSVVDGLAVRVTAENSGGAATAEFLVTVSEKLVLPVLLTAPVLVGTAKVGQAMSVSEGTWSGTPMPAFGFQWLCDGEPVEGATGREFTPEADLDLRELSCQVTATNTAGAALEETASLTVTHVAPELVGELFEEVVDQGSGPLEVETAPVFFGENLSYEVAGAGARIDAETGLLTISTAAPLDGENITVTAKNSGGEVSGSFMVTVEELEVVTPEPPAEDQWKLLESVWAPAGQEETFRPMVWIDPELQVHEAQWTTSGQVPALENHWETLAPTGEPNQYVTAMLNQGTGDWDLFADGTKRQGQFRIRYRDQADGEWSEEAQARTVQQPVPEPPKPEEEGAWKPFFFASKDAYDDQKTYRYGKSGYQLQFMHCGDRSPVNPDKACFGQDVSGLWTTKNASDEYPVWGLPRHAGIGNRYSVSVKFDPTIEDRLIFLVSDQSRGNSGGGIYVSDDFGESFRKALEITAVPGGSSSAYGGYYRAWRELIAFDPANHDRWYVFNPEDISSNGAGGEVWQSTDRGETWTKISTDPESKGMGRCWKIAFSGSDILAACDEGLWRSTNDGKTWTKQSPSGLPDGRATSMDINPDNGNDIHVVVLNKGLYRSTDGGRSFKAVKTGNYNQIFISTADRDVQYLVATNQLENKNIVSQKAQVSTNGGNSWSNIELSTNTYGWEFPNWQNKFNNKVSNNIELQSGILPHPGKPLEAIATTKCMFFRTTDGKNFLNRSDGVDNLGSGHANVGNILFDPNNPDRMVFNIYDYGAYVTENGGLWFERRSAGNTGLASHISGQYSGSFSPDNPNHLITTYGQYSADSAVAFTKDFGKNWTRPPVIINDKDGGKPHMTFASFSLVPGEGNWMYTDHHVSSDTGATWSTWASRGTGFPSGYDAKVVACSHQDGKVLYAVNASQDRVYRTSNRGGSWSLYTTFGTSLKSQRQPQSFALSPVDDSVIYWWRRDSGLMRFDGKTTTALGTDLKGLNMVKVRIDPRNPDLIYLLAGANGRPMVFRSVDAGRTFEDISGNLPLLNSHKGLEVCPHHGIVFVIGTTGTRFIAPPNPTADAKARVEHWTGLFG
ncbi:VPS10 domain-containing protein [Amaricoccus tamworthensis]|uniref:VPS10 domain-containing protein n=1 Tax=Amaricoccus tamworthensis TaxID=57002 RepID=UPI003C7CA0F8